MGNANAKVHNDTNKTVRVYIYNYADAIRHEHRSTHVLKPGATIDVEAAAHGSGLIVSTSVADDGKHRAVGNGETLRISDLLQHGDSNPWYESAVEAIAVAAAMRRDGEIDEIVYQATKASMHLWRNAALERVHKEKPSDGGWGGFKSSVYNGGLLLPGDTGSLQSVAHGTFLSGWNDGTARLANHRKCWEEWEVVPAGHGKIALKSKEHGTFLSAWDDGSLKMQKHCQAWEHWLVVDLHEGGGRIKALRSHRGTYLSAFDDGSLRQAPHAKCWEHWQAVI